MVENSVVILDEIVPEQELVENPMLILDEIVPKEVLIENSDKVHDLFKRN
ncbi:hypothetical protein ACFFF5_11165 [Lederbergia wuyishanensis]|uniref:Uncharacterized protein n=1 Tax=Lederbergia wuyishanensis TaxID=1347903 RepID=A0ABU0D490_9BACI|nr:hypothetical protein [Lederbergia wuyishanensis]MCJ8008188.1 hypothetical protein [Lederbergia wuyishanensis]MDQ0343223.1 hypothetical protein [Lederbergia wuyishanensis]